MNGTYNAFVYNARATKIIQDHDPSTPLFMYLLRPILVLKTAETSDIRVS